MTGVKTVMQIHLKAVREQKQISIRQLAKKSGVARSHIEKIENGRSNPTIFVICKLAKALEVSAYDLFSCD